MRNWNSRPLEDALQAEVERLKGIIRKAEWVTYYQDYPVSDSFRACAVCDNDYLLGHDPTCPFYQWEGGKASTYDTAEMTPTGGNYE